MNVYNDDKKTELIGEASVDIDALVLRGSGGLEYWQPLKCRGKFAGEVKLKLAFSNSQGKRVSVQQPRRSPRTVSGEKRNMDDACIRDDSTRMRKVNRKAAPSIFQEPYTAAVEQTAHARGPRPIRTPKALGPRSMVPTAHNNSQQQNPQTATATASQNLHKTVQTSLPSNDQQQQQQPVNHYQHQEQQSRQPLQKRAPHVGNSQDAPVEAESSIEHAQQFNHPEPLVKGPPRIRLRRLDHFIDGDMVKKTERAEPAQAERMIQSAQTANKKTESTKAAEQPAEKADHPPAPPSHKQPLPPLKQQQHIQPTTQPIKDDSEALKPAPLSLGSKKPKTSQSAATAAKPVPPHLYIPKNHNQAPPRRITPRKTSRSSSAKLSSKPRITSGIGSRVAKKAQAFESITKPKTQHTPRRLATPESKSKITKSAPKTTNEPLLRLRQPSSRKQTPIASQQPLPSPRLTPEPECDSPKTTIHHTETEEKEQPFQAAASMPTPPPSSNGSNISTPENPFAYIQEQLSMFTSNFTPTHSTTSDYSPSPKSKTSNAQRCDPQIEAAIKRLCDAEYAIHRLRNIASSSNTHNTRSKRRVSRSRRNSALPATQPINKPSYEPQTEDLGIAFI